MRTVLLLRGQALQKTRANPTTPLIKTSPLPSLERAAKGVSLEICRGLRGCRGVTPSSRRGCHPFATHGRGEMLLLRISPRSSQQVRLVSCRNCSNGGNKALAPHSRLTPHGRCSQAGPDTRCPPPTPASQTWAREARCGSNLIVRSSPASTAQVCSTSCNGDV